MQDNNPQKNYTIKSVFSNYAGYNKLLNFYSKATRSKSKEIQLSINSFLNANLAAVLQPLLEQITEQQKSITFNIENEKIRDILQINGFLCSYGDEPVRDSKKTAIPLLKIPRHDNNKFNNYLLKELMQHNQLKRMNEQVSREVKRNIHEIYKNAQIHSDTENIYVCGQYFPGYKRLEFTIVDTGIGFRECVRRKFKRELTSELAIRWAIKSGNTTKNMTGGLGLSDLHEFIDLNGGELHIITGNAFYRLIGTRKNSYTNEDGVKITEITPSRHEYRSFHKEFTGSIINIIFYTENIKEYRVPGAVSIDDIF